MKHVTDSRRAIVIATLMFILVGCGAESPPVTSVPDAAQTAESEGVRDWMPIGASSYEATRAEQRAAMLLFAADW